MTQKKTYELARGFTLEVQMINCKPNQVANHKNFIVYFTIKKA
jgi:hypothetical protein